MDTLYAYLAGIIDADGFISIKRSTYQSRVLGKPWNPNYQERIGIKQVRPEAIALLHETFGGYRGTQKPGTPNSNSLHTWDATNACAARTIRALRPFLRIKTRQADIALELRTSKESKEARLRGSPAKRKQAASVVAEREQWFLAIHALNDVRPRNPRLI